MASENETVEAVLREMRDRSDKMVKTCLGTDFGFESFADRIESAWRREKAELQLALDAEKASHTDDYKDERIRAQDAEIMTLKSKLAELCKRMKEVLDDYVCKGGAAFENGCEGCVDAIGCRLPRWRKALEGAKAPVSEGGES